jgi:hypothetical protein
MFDAAQMGTVVAAKANVAVLDQFNAMKVAAGEQD